jgi:tetratricopeptide (TPR) repeat protein
MRLSTYLGGLGLLSSTILPVFAQDAGVPAPATIVVAQDASAIQPLAGARPFMVALPFAVAGERAPGEPVVRHTPTGVVQSLMAQITPAPEPAQAPNAVDETALRYFAQNGDEVRVQREIERLKALHPGWQPPANLLSQDYVPDPDIVEIWEMFSNGDFDGARAAIAAKQAADPSFVPSTDLLQSLASGESVSRLRTASDAKDYQAVITIAASNPQLLVCSSVDNLWRLAEAFAQTGSLARSVDAYAYVLSNCTDAQERYATMQKAMEQLPRAELDPLLAMERPDAAGVGEFNGLRLDLARRAVSAALDDGPAPGPADLALLEQSATATKNGEDLQLLGYFELSRNRPNEARRLFQTAHEAAPSAATAEGLAVTLLQLQDGEEAEGVLAAYRDESEELTALYLQAAAAYLATEPRRNISENVLGRIVDTAMSARDANTAQELGWYSYAFQQPQTAFEWFTVALRFQPDLEPAAYGLMVAANALGDATTVQSIRNQWAGRSARISDFGKTSATTQPPAAAPVPVPVAQRPSAPVQSAPVQSARQPTNQVASELSVDPGPQRSSGSRRCEKFVPAASLSASNALSHAWCLMDLNRPAQAVDHFARALQSGSERVRSDAAYGQSLAFIRLGLPHEAAVAAAAAPVTNARALELEVAILTQQATSAYGVGDYAKALAILDARSRYAAERNDLLTLRAWSYYHLRRYREAQRIFSAVAATGYGEALAGLEAATSALARSLVQ